MEVYQNWVIAYQLFIDYLGINSSY